MASNEADQQQRINKMIIFSTANGSVQTVESMEDVANTLGRNVQAMYGYYQGEQETSFITKDVEAGKRLAAKYNQYCYLERGHYGVWYLVETATTKVLDWYKGIFEVSEKEALEIGEYSILDGKYFTAKK